MGNTQRQGILVKPYCRLSEKQVALIDSVSREILAEPGLICNNAEAADIFKKAGAKVEDKDGSVRIRLDSKLIDKVLKSAPSKVTLGARERDNRLVLDANEPRVRFGSGSETNVWLDVEFDDGRPIFTRKEGSIERLCKAAHLCENLEHLDFFIRCVNICDTQVTSQNKDANKFFASLDNITKHVQAGLTDISALDSIIKMGQIIAGGKEAFEKEPVLSFITCVIKSPLQIVDDTAAKLIEISRRRVPVVMSSCPMGGATGPFDEFGMVAQINAELLAGVALNQIISPGAPVLYGAVAVRTRLDSLYDMYGAPEFNHYNMDCAQMARFYGLPCYSSAAVADTSQPGIQATLEKLMTLIEIPKAGPQYIHYAFGLLERTNVFCPQQAIIDNEHVGIVKHMLAESDGVCEENRTLVLDRLREVMASDHKTYMYHLPIPSRDKVYTHYPLESEEGGPLYAAHQKYEQIQKMPAKHLPQDIRQEILDTTPEILPQLREMKPVAEK